MTVIMSLQPLFELSYSVVKKIIKLELVIVFDVYFIKAELCRFQLKSTQASCFGHVVRLIEELIVLYFPHIASRFDLIKIQNSDQ